MAANEILGVAFKRLSASPTISPWQTETLLLFTARCYLGFFLALVLWAGEPSLGFRPHTSQVDGVPDMASACWLCGDWAHQSNNSLCQHFCLGESCLLYSCPDAGQFSFSPYVSVAPVLENLEGMSPNKSVCRPFKRKGQVL